MAEAADSYRATVAITTKDRREELRRALRSALAQQPPVEVLVIDDGSSDGTSDMVREEFPGVRLERSERSLGLIAQRNRAARLASAPILVSLDDDAEFSTPGTVAQTLAEFDDPRIGAVAIPHIDVRKGSQFVLADPPRDGRRYATFTYIGTAHAIRRDLFLRLGGYREELFHQAEESDYCARMLQAGYVVRLGGADHIVHYESPRRVSDRYYYYGRRNDTLYAWQNVPMPYLLGRLAKVTVHGLLIGLRAGRLRVCLRGLVRGYAEGIRSLPRRRPLSREVYAAARRLRIRRALPLDEIAASLPPAAEPS